MKKKKIMGSTASKTWSLANGRGVDNRTHLKKKKIMGSTASKTWSLANGRGVDNRTHLKKKKIMGSTASKTWSLANGRGVDNRTHLKKKKLWVRPRQRPGPSPTAGGRQQNSREKNKKKKTVGPTASKDLVPRQRQGGRQQNSLTTKKRTCFINWNVYRNLTITATGSILSKRIGIAPEAKQTRGTLPNQAVAPLANNNKKILRGKDQVCFAQTNLNDDSNSNGHHPKNKFNSPTCTTPDKGVGRQQRQLIEKLPVGNATSIY